MDAKLGRRAILAFALVALGCGDGGNRPSAGRDGARDVPADSPPTVEDTRGGADAGPDARVDGTWESDATARADVPPDARPRDARPPDLRLADGAAGPDVPAAETDASPDGGDVARDACACTSGPCCDDCGFRPAGWVCDPAGAEERGCPWGIRCGTANGVRRTSRLCSGASAACDGALGEPGEWEVADDCTAPKGCVDGACLASAACVGGDCPAAACPSIEGAAGSCNLATGRCEYELSPNTDTWVLISPGTFEMGPAPGEIPLHPTQVWARHDVTLTRPFLVRATELTQREWDAVMDHNPYVWPGERFPQTHLTWWDALAYCNALSRSEGLPECYELRECTGTPGDHPIWGDAYWEQWFHCEPVGLKSLDCPGYRLPTEAEWEYVCRAGSPTELPSGGTWSGDLCDAPEIAEFAWFAANSGGTEYGSRGVCCACLDCNTYPFPEPRCGPREVGQKLANGWGLYDVLGNEHEWTGDWGWDFYPEEPVVDPLGGPAGHFNPSDPEEERHIYRGGVYSGSATGSRCTVRFSASGETSATAVRLVRTVW